MPTIKEDWDKNLFNGVGTKVFDSKENEIKGAISAHVDVGPEDLVKVTLVFFVKEVIFSKDVKKIVIETELS